MRGARRWCLLDLGGHDLSGLLESCPFLPSDATAVALLVHSNSYQLVRFGEPGATELPDARDQAYPIRPSDRVWTDSPPPGPECRCSRCRQPIVRELPVRFPVLSEIAFGPRVEYRFHGECLGLIAPPELGAA